MAVVERDERPRTKPKKPAQSKKPQKAPPRPPIEGLDRPSRKREAYKQVNEPVASGEKFGSWFMRRHKMVSNPVVPLPMQFYLASSRLSDKELSSIGKAVPHVKQKAKERAGQGSWNPVSSKEWADRYSRLTEEERKSLGPTDPSSSGTLWWNVLKPALQSAAMAAPASALLGGTVAGGAAATRIGAWALKLGLSEEGALGVLKAMQLATFGGGVSAASGIGGGPDPVFEFTEENLAAPIAAGADVVTAAIPGGRPAISFKEALENAREGGSGRSITVALGVDPESNVGRGIAAVSTILLHGKVSPDAVGAKISRAGRMAERIPAADQLRRRSLLEQRIVRAVATDRTEDLVFASQGKLNRDSKKIFRDVQRYEGNPNAFLRLYSSGTGRTSAFDYSHFVDLEVAARQGEEAFGDALASLMRGERPYTSRSMLQGRANTVQERIDKIDTDLAKIPDRDMTGATPKARVKLLDEKKGLARQKSSLEKAASEDAFVTPVRELPDATLFNEMRVKLRSSDSGFLGSLGRVLEKDWAQKVQVPWFTRIPRRVLNLTDEGVDVAREDLSRIGGLLRLEKKRVDHYVKEIFESASDTERVDLYKAMLAEGGQNFPSRLRDQATQFSSNPGGSIYAVDRAGDKVGGWFRRRKTPLGDMQNYDQPLLVSQLATEIPVPNPRALIEMKTWGGKARIALKGFGDGAFSEAVRKSKTLRSVTNTAAEAWKTTNHVLNFMSVAIWSPLVLLRPGWTVKVTGEERIRMMMLGLPRHEAGVLSIFGRIRPGSLKKLVREGLIPEDALTDVGRGILGDSRPGLATINKGQKGWEQHLQHELLKLNHDPVLQRLLRTGKESTLDWLENRGKVHADRMMPVLRNVEGPAGRGVNLSGWLDKIEEVYVKSGRFSDEALDAIKNGKFKGVDLDSPRVLDEFARFPEKLPSTIIQNNEFWLSSAGMLRRGANVWFDWAGSKSTNALNRSRMFQLLHTAEMRRYAKLGIPEKIADETAKRWAVKQIAEVLYESTERSANDLILRTISPFLPAWKEVLKTWTVTLPRSYGNPLVGHAVIARKLANVKEALEENKMVYRNSSKQWVVEIPGVGEVNAQSFNILGNWPIGGPVASGALAVLSSMSKKMEGILDPLQPFGVDTNLGAGNINRLWTGTFGGRKIGPMTLPAEPPWEVLSWEKQKQTIAGARIDWLRAEGMARMQEIAKMPRGAKRESAIEALKIDAERGAASFFLARGITGAVLPFSPRHYWAGQKEHQEFMDSLDSLPDDVRGKMIDEWAAEHPEWALFTVPKSVRIRGESEREDSFDAYWADIRKGNVKRYTVDQWVDLSLFLMNYSAAKAAKREKLAEIGTTAGEWANNAHDYYEASADLSDEIERLRAEFPKGFNIWDENLRRSRERRGLPIADAELQKSLDASRALRRMQDDLLEIDPFADTEAFGIVKRFNRTMLEALDVDSYFTDAELKSGPDREMGLYFKNVVAPYWERADQIRQEHLEKDLASDEDISRGYLELQKHRNAWEAPAGFEDFPHPEEYTYRKLTPEQQQIKKIRWASSPPSFLTSFQRAELGIEDSSKVLRYWERVREVEIQAAAHIEKNGFQSSSKEAKNVREIVSEWKRDLAAKNGLSDDLNMGETLRFDRLQRLGVLPSSFDRAASVAKAAWARLDSIRKNSKEVGVGPNTKAGLPVFHAFADWFEGQLSSNPELARDFLILNAAAPKESRMGKQGLRSIGFRQDGLISWLFFSD